MERQDGDEDDGLTLRPAAPDELHTLAALAEVCQRTPERGIPYVGDDATSIEADIRDVAGDDRWHEAAVVAAVDGRIVGWLCAERGHDKGRVWWFGPFVAPDVVDDVASTVADALYAWAAPLREGFAEEEICYDQRSRWLAAFGSRHDFVEDVASLDLRFDYPPDDGPHGDGPHGDGPHGDGPHGDAGRATPDVEVPRTSSETAAIVDLHDELFAGTHLDGHEVATPTSSERVTWCRTVDGAVVGYVAVEHQHDNSLYIDFLGVAPDARRQGHAEALVRHALGHGAGLGVTHAHLTVRSTNVGARRLYESLGFTESMVIVPARKGFLFGPG